jgi:hypothetical protein
MSVVQISSIKQYWETNPFSGHTDFRDTMSRTEFCLGNDRQDCVDCVHGLVPLPHWTDDSVMNQEMFLAPAPVMAYNMFMNSVDCMDQRRQ